MKLLIITQKVDKEDPVLGFFHNWLIEFSKKFESLVVICLEKGKVELPENIKVVSLGKETGASKIKYIWNFYKYIWGERNNYDAVFIHMNQEYVLLGWKLWFLLGKKIYLWRNHPAGNLLTKLAVLLSNKVFCTSPQSYTAQFKKTVIMPVGIDTEVFKDLKMERNKNSILSLGRISPIKNIHLLLEAIKILENKDIDFEANIYGDALPKDNNYYEKLKTYESNRIHFFKPVPNYKTAEIYNQHQIFINLTPSGSFDKTILEAAACGCITIVANKSLSSDFQNLIVEAKAESIAEKLEFWLKAKELINKTSQDLREYVSQNHSLDTLVNKLQKEIQK